ncbi:MAG: hypothetical protein AB7P69_24160 [Candidatus Binatia bacterium]
MEDRDLIVDVILDGRVLNPQEIPPVISAEVETILVRGEGPTEIHHEGMRYVLFVRPCVYP